MDVTVIQALTKYFNQEPAKRAMTAWRDELKALSDTEKLELAQGASTVMGWTLKV